jgi:hypothetical protein
MASPIAQFFVSMMVERPAARRGTRVLADELESALAPLVERLQRSKAPERASKQSQHIVGIERWGQQRLRVALGEASFERDSHHPYLPDANLDLPALLDVLRNTRAETVALARRIEQQGRGAERVEHNALGPMSANGWLRYLRVHADLEARRV